jgi:hypothetical protein
MSTSADARQNKSTCSSRSIAGVPVAEGLGNSSSAYVIPSRARPRHVCLPSRTFAFPSLGGLALIVLCAIVVGEVLGQIQVILGKPLQALAEENKEMHQRMLTEHQRLSSVGISHDEALIENTYRVRTVSVIHLRKKFTSARSAPLPLPKKT